MYGVISFLGLFGFMIIAWLFSNNKKIINWQVVLWGLVMQFLFAGFIFIIPAGSKIFLGINDSSFGVDVKVTKKVNQLS